LAGSDTYDALQNYLQFLRESVACVTTEVLIPQEGGYHPRDEPYVLTFGGGDVRVHTSDGGRLGIRIVQHYFMVPAEGRLGLWKVTVDAYEYTLLDEGLERELIAYHKHPRGSRSVSYPHLHVLVPAERPELAMAHLPTRRISVEEFLYCLIRDFRVRPRRGDWEEVLRRNRERFDEYRTWT
jgi:hypothetical protein